MDLPWERCSNDPLWNDLIKPYLEHQRDVINQKQIMSDGSDLKRLSGELNQVLLLLAMPAQYQEARDSRNEQRKRQEALRMRTEVERGVRRSVYGS